MSQEQQSGPVTQAARRTTPTAIVPLRLPAAVHEEVERELDVAYAAGYEAGWAAARAVERDAIREALWPTAPTLRAAVAAHCRDVDRIARRRSA